MIFEEFEIEWKVLWKAICAFHKKKEEEVEIIKFFKDFYSFGFV